MLEIFQYLHDNVPMHDKMAHLFYSSIFSVIYYCFFRESGIFLILIISIIKEFLDQQLGNYYDMLDVIYSIIPSSILEIIIKCERT